MATDRKEADIKIIPTTNRKLIAAAGVLLVMLAATGWWYSQPNHTEAVSGGAGILATAPAAPPRPLNADGAPKSD